MHKRRQHYKKEGQQELQMWSLFGSSIRRNRDTGGGQGVYPCEVVVIGLGER